MSTGASSGSEAFDRLRDGLSDNPTVRSELEAAMRLNVERVNPSDPGNRFIVGGAVEWLIAAAAWSLGVLTLPGGHSVRGFDLMDLQNAARGLWSVKAQTSRNSAAFRITNGLGGSGKGFLDPTVFVSPRLPGLVFIDPSIHQDVTATLELKGDATVLPFRAVREHALQHSECVAPLTAPTNEGRGQENPFLAYTETIVSPGQFPRLSAMFRDARPSTSTTAEDVGRLVEMRSQGHLTEEQFNRLIERIANS